MEPLIVLAITFVLLWVLFIRPQQRRVRGHQQLVAALEPGDQVVLTAGIYGRIVEMGPEDMTVEVAPGVELRVARQAVLRRIEDATALPIEPDVVEPASADDIDREGLDPSFPSDHHPDADGEPAAPQPDDRGPTAPGSPAAS